MFDCSADSLIYTCDASHEDDHIHEQPDRYAKDEFLIRCAIDV